MFKSIIQFLALSTLINTAHSETGIGITHAPSSHYLKIATTINEMTVVVPSLDDSMPSLKNQSQEIRVVFEFYGSGSNGEYLWNLKDYSPLSTEVKLK